MKNLKSIIFSVIGSNAIAAGLGFTVNVLLARSLSIGEYGSISYVLSVVIILYTLTSLGLTNTTVITSNESLATQEIAIGRINELFKYYLILLIICFFIPVATIAVIKSADFTFITMLVGSILFNVYRYNTTINQAAGKWNIYNSLNIANNGTKIVIIGVALFVAKKFLNSENVLIVLNSALIIYYTVVVIISLRYTRHIARIREKLDLAFTRKFLSVLVPLGITDAFIILHLRYPILFIESTMTQHELGIFNAASSLAIAFPIITSSMMNVLIRESAKKDDTHLLAIYSTQKRIIKYLIPLIVLMILSSDILITSVFGKSYQESTPIFQILIVGFIGGIFFVPLESYFYSRNPKFIVGLKFLSLVTIIIFSLILVDIYGLVGVAYSSLLSRVTTWIVLISFTKFKIGKFQHE